MATLSQIEEEDNEIYAYVVLGAICIGFLLLLTQLYYANYDLVQRLHIDIPFLDKHVFSKEGMKLLLCKMIFPFCLIASMIKTCFCKLYHRLELGLFATFVPPTAH